MIRKDEMSAVANEQVAADMDAEFAQTIDLANQRHWIDDDAVPDDAPFPAPQNSRRNQVQNVLRPAMDNSMPGVIPTLAAHNDVRLRSEDIDDFAFAFVPPLRADQDGVGHG